MSIRDCILCRTTCRITRPHLSPIACLFPASKAAWSWTFGRLSNPLPALENQDWTVHTQTYLLKWSWRLINTCNLFLCCTSKCDFRDFTHTQTQRERGGRETKTERAREKNKTFLLLLLCFFIHVFFRAALVFYWRAASVWI